jgi:arsenate reductase-like glutaredoxin family protein
MLILKIKEKGLYVEIPGALPTRTPAEIDITRCNLAAVDMYLRKSGISNYQIMSVASNGEITTPKPIDMRDGSLDQKTINKRFSNLEKMVAQLLDKNKDDKNQNSEQITNKLDKLESLAQKLLDKEPKVVERFVTTTVSRAKSKKFEDDPEIEELDEKFIPKIDTSKMKMKGGAKKAVKQDKIDIDDSADLLSRIMGQND